MNQNLDIVLVAGVDACSGTGACNVTLSQSTALSAHFSLSGNDNSIIDYRNRTDWKTLGTMEIYLTMEILLI